jgi:hypothetical protein
MVYHSASPFFDGKEASSEHQQVLITEYLTDTSKPVQESRAEEYNTIAVSPNDHRWYRCVAIDQRDELIRSIFDAWQIDRTT